MVALRFGKIDDGVLVFSRRDEQASRRARG
jgi:hypothetical protein